jgi:hypothetical protein
LDISALRYFPRLSILRFIKRPLGVVRSRTNGTGFLYPPAQAIHERLDDLTKIAQRLQAVLDAERARDPLPIFLLCRLAIDVDNAVTMLQRPTEGLAGPILESQ